MKTYSIFLNSDNTFMHIEGNVEIGNRKPDFIIDTEDINDYIYSNGNMTIDPIKYSIKIDSKKINLKNRIISELDRIGRNAKYGYPETEQQMWPFFKSEADIAKSNSYSMAGATNIVSALTTELGQAPTQLQFNSRVDRIIANSLAFTEIGNKISGDRIRLNGPGGVVDSLPDGSIDNFDIKSNVDIELQAYL